MIGTTLHRLTRWLPIVLAGCALALVIFAVATGWQIDLPDEGAAAHSFQLLVGLAACSTLLFIATMPGERAPRDWRMVVLQLAAIAAAFAPVAWFGL